MPDRTFGTEAHLAAIGARLVKLQGAAAWAARSSAAWRR